MFECHSSFLRLGNEELATLARDAIKGIEYEREQVSSRLIELNDEKKREYETKSFLRKVFSEKPPNHPKNERAEIGANNWRMLVLRHPREALRVKACNAIAAAESGGECYITFDDYNSFLRYAKR